MIQTLADGICLKLLENWSAKVKGEDSLNESTAAGGENDSWGLLDNSLSSSSDDENEMLSTDSFLSSRELMWKHH